MSGVTEPLTPPLPPHPPARRGYRRALISLAIVLVILAILIGLDRAAAAYAENRVASQMTSYGFPTKPSVTIEGFPFLTQLLSKHINAVDISASNFHAGPVTARVQARATGISLNSGYSSGTIADITGTGLITFSDLASVARAAGAPGLKISPAGPHEVKLTANLNIVNLTAIARIIKTGPGKFTIHIVSAGGIPAPVLAPVQNLTIHIPPLPLGLTAGAVSVTTQGVAVRITGHQVPFGH